MRCIWPAVAVAVTSLLHCKRLQVASNRAVENPCDNTAAHQFHTLDSSTRRQCCCTAGLARVLPLLSMLATVRHSSNATWVCCSCKLRHTRDGPAPGTYLHTTLSLWNLTQRIPQPLTALLLRQAAHLLHLQQDLQCTGSSGTQAGSHEQLQHPTTSRLQ